MEVSGKRLDDEIVSKLCEPCQNKHLSTQADGYCDDCGEYMCQTCFQSHLTMKLGRNHVLGAMPGEKGRGQQKQEDKCKKHTREAIKYYCRNHDRVVCGDCIVLDHRTCKLEFITDLAKKFEESSEFKNFLGQIEKQEADISESGPRIESYRKENQTLFDNAIREIKKLRSEINIWLDKIEKNIEAEVKKISDENEMHLSELEKTIRHVSDDIVKIKEDLDSNVFQAGSLFIRRVECKPKVEIIEKSVSEIKSDRCIEKYYFEPETKVKEFLTSSMKLGIIKVTTVDKTENTTTTEAVSSKKNVYQLPDPRAAGFDVGKRVGWTKNPVPFELMNHIMAKFNHTHTVKQIRSNMHVFWKGTVTAVDPSGYVDVQWDNAHTSSNAAGAGGLYEVKLL